MGAILSGTDYRKTGSPPYFPYDEGSFANGGAMRASPLGIVFRSASPTCLRLAAAEAVRSSHVHPEAVDGAALQAQAVAFAIQCCIAGRAADFQPVELLEQLIAHAETVVFKRRLAAVQMALSEVTQKTDDVCVLQDLLADGDPRTGSGFAFQIAACDLMPCVFWITCRYHHDPEEAIMRAVAIGGDTDTCACLVGAILGALHGTQWIPRRWWDGIENGKRGRDYAVALAEKLAQVDLQKPITWGGDARSPV
jgi:poly(ADP-ribose) glycohydrolase ARH3